MTTFTENECEYKNIRRELQGQPSQSDLRNLLIRVVDLHEICKEKIAKKRGKASFSGAVFVVSALTVNFIGMAVSGYGATAIAVKLDEYDTLVRDVKLTGRQICRDLGLGEYESPSVGMISLFCDGLAIGAFKHAVGNIFSNN